MQQGYLEKVEITAQMVMTIQQFVGCLQKLNPELQIDITWFITPDRFSKEWKSIFALIVHFLQFKDEYEQYHKQQQEDIEEKQTALVAFRAQLQTFKLKLSQLNEEQSAVKEESKSLKGSLVNIQLGLKESG